jgi:hypothetical protein
MYDPTHATRWENCIFVGVKRESRGAKGNTGRRPWGQRIVSLILQGLAYRPHSLHADWVIHCAHMYIHEIGCSGFYILDMMIERKKERKLIYLLLASYMLRTVFLYLFHFWPVLHILQEKFLRSAYDRNITSTPH